MNCPPNVKENDIKLISHSRIIDYPINYELFPLAKKCNIYEIELKKNEYLLIPKRWFHWVYTEPNSIALSIEIDNISGDKNNFLIDNIINNKPYKAIGKGIIDVNYQDFIKNLYEEKFKALLSSTTDLSPVYKNDKYKIFIDEKLEDIINISKSTNMYSYIGAHHLSSNLFWTPYRNVDNFIDVNDIILFNKNSIWFNLDKPIQSGLHNDYNDRILYLLEGSKKIYLIPPDQQRNLYITPFYRVKNYTKSEK